MITLNNMDYEFSILGFINKDGVMFAAIYTNADVREVLSYANDG